MADSKKKVIIEVKLDDQASAGLQKVQASTEKTTANMATSFAKVAAVATAVIVTAKQMYNAVSVGINTSAQLETATQGFKALLGSAEEASGVIERIKKEAKQTPFEIAGLVEGALGLTAITKNGQQAIDILLDVGKAVAISGKGQNELDRVVWNLQQIAATGTVTMMDVRQFQSAIPVFNDVLALSGLTVESLQESENAAELLFAAFEKYGTEGTGASAFTEQAGTWNQLISNAKDSWNIFMSDFVNKTGLFDAAKNAIEKVTMFITEKLTPAIVIMRDWFVGTWETIKSKYEENVKPILDAFISMVSDFLKPAIDNLKAALNEMFMAFNIDGERMKEILKVIVQIIGVMLLGAIVVVIGIIKVLINVIAGVVSIITAVKKAGTDTWNAFIDRLATMINQFREIWYWVQKIIEKIKAIPTNIGINFSGNDKRATGGVTTGGWTMVGERGAELVQLPRGSHVYNSEDTKQMSSGGGITINVNAPVTGVDNLKATILEAVNEATAKQNRLANYNLL